MKVEWVETKIVAKYVAISLILQLKNEKHLIVLHCGVYCFRIAKRKKIAFTFYGSTIVILL